MYTRGMIDTYVAFDVETPNTKNDRMSAIGIALIQKNQIVDGFYSLVNPETYFNAFHVQLTHIGPQTVQDAPTFVQIWPKLETYLSQGILLAHNAPFDLSVLVRCLEAYHIHWKDYIDYADTVRIGKACYPELENHKLNTMCDALNIPLSHHNALSDAKACASLFTNYYDQINTDYYIRTYDVAKHKTLSMKKRRP